jgi:hypothetical protein
MSVDAALTIYMGLAHLFSPLRCILSDQFGRLRAMVEENSKLSTLSVPLHNGSAHMACADRLCTAGLWRGWLQDNYVCLSIRLL